MERTFLLIKPDGVKRRLVGEIITRLEKKGLCLVSLKLVHPTEEILREHYSAHVSKPFFPGLLKYMLSGPVIAMVWEGAEAVRIARDIIGATNPRNAAVGTIRGDYGMCTGRNLIHGSDSVESAMNEVKIWFGEVKAVEMFDRDIIYE